MITLTKFGSGSRLYTFPTHAQVSYSDNFASMVTKTTRLAGVNGGFSNLGTGPGLSPIGTVRADLWLTFADYVEATDKLVSLRQMIGYGLMPLWRQPLYGAPQFCWARLSDTQLQQNVHDVPHQRMKIPLVFEVPDPFWHRTVSGFGILWGDGVSKWGDGTSKWGSSNSYAVSSTLTQSFSNPGNTYTLPRLKLKNSSGSAVTDIRVRRIVDGYAEDEFYYNAPLADGTYLDVDPVRQRVTIGPVGTNALDDFQPMKGPDWLRLMPGSNSIRVDCNGSLTLILSYLERSI